MSVLSSILKAAAPLPKIEQFDRYLMIGPHPDDIEIGMGATAAKLAATGKHVTFLICLDGRYGLSHAPEGTTPEKLIQIRKAESLASAKTLGVSDVRFLDLSDGGFYQKEELLRRMAQVIGDVQPQLLFAPDPAVSSESHADHLNVGNVARELSFFASIEEIMAQYDAKPAPVQGIAYYMTARPNAYITTSKELLNKQLSSVFNCHLSQFPKNCQEAASISLYLKLRSFFFGLRKFHPHAEGFRLLGLTHMHCMPESAEW